MSQAAMLLSVAEFIRANFTFKRYILDEVWCAVEPDGRPPPAAGEFFIAVHQGGFRNESMEYLHNRHTINLTLTLKIARLPIDRAGIEAIVEMQDGLDEVADWLADNIHLNYEIMGRANELIVEKNKKLKIDSINQFIEPLRFSTSGACRIVTGEWFHGASQGSGEVGLVQEVVFHEAVRVKIAANQPTVTDSDRGF